RYNCCTIRLTMKNFVSSSSGSMRKIADKGEIEKAIVEYVAELEKQKTEVIEVEVDIEELPNDTPETKPTKPIKI
ncbi:hypothetical protein LJB89_04800, partial [Tyzzerella sp. OttesenSCG-928-J15]|nr:hypothetical protein [Tyzzerella sp. OttesenSCG-928-J15]